MLAAGAQGAISGSALVRRVEAHLGDPETMLAEVADAPSKPDDLTFIVFRPNGRLGGRALTFRNGAEIRPLFTHLEI